MIELPAKKDTQHTSSLPPTNVTVYLRLSDSKSVKIQLPSSIPLFELKSTITFKLGLPIQTQLLFLGGKELKEGKTFTLTERSILHVKDRRELLEDMTIQLVLHQPQKENLFRTKFTSTPIKVQQGERIKDFLDRYLAERTQQVDLKRSRVIECGRFLRGSKTFGQQKVQQNAQVHIILRHALPKQGQDQQQNQHHEMFIKRVLKHSRNNSKEIPNLIQNQERRLDGGIEIQEEEERKIFQENRFESEILVKTQHDLGGNRCENSHHHNHNCDVDPHLRHSLQPQALQKSNPEFQTRPMRNSFLNHTKSSQRWVRAKFKLSQLTPIKLGLTQYKKYDGPLSVRGCNCKRRPFESKGRDSVKSQEEQTPCLSPLPSIMTKSQCKLKKSMTIIG